MAGAVVVGLALLGPGARAAGAGTCSDSQGIYVLPEGDPDPKVMLIAPNTDGNESGTVSGPVATANDLVLEKVGAVNFPGGFPDPLKQPYDYVVPHGLWPLVHETNCDVVANNGL